MSAGTGFIVRYNYNVQLDKRDTHEWWSANAFPPQVGLGIATLLTYVPTPLAASHQSGSLVLLSLAIWLTHEIKLLKYIPK